jgi:O-antigen/teichoic acid export membrane protein
MFNIVLIPLYGVEGAAISTLITLIIANYLINYFDKDLRKLVFICNSSITLKWLWNEK